VKDNNIRMLSRADLRREMEAHMGGPPDDPTRCVTNFKVQSHLIAIATCAVFPTFLVSTRHLVRGPGVARILRKFKKQVQLRRY
jgi:hypothetical protein